jgi:transcription antitermination factor NusA-like protein
MLKVKNNGLAGGDWNIIERIIQEELNGEDVTVVKYVP